MIEIKDGVVLKDGKEVGTIAEDGSFNPIEGLHHKTRESVERFLASERGDIKGDENEGATGGSETVGVITSPDEPSPAAPLDPVPEQDPYAGDKTPAYIEWFQRNHTPAEFNAKYPAHRRFNRF